MAESMSLSSLELSLFNRDMIKLLDECEAAGLETELRKELGISDDEIPRDAVERLKMSMFAERYKALMVRVLMDHFRQNPDEISRFVERTDSELTTGTTRPVVYSIEASRYIPTFPLIPEVLSARERSTIGGYQDRISLSRNAASISGPTGSEQEAMTREGSLEAPRREAGDTLREALTLVGTDLSSITLELLDRLGYSPAENEIWTPIESTSLDKTLAAIPDFARILVKARESTRAKQQFALREVHQSALGMLLRSAYPDPPLVSPEVADLMLPFGIDVKIANEVDTPPPSRWQSRAGGMIDGVAAGEDIWNIPRSFSTRLEAEMIVIKSAITEYLSADR